MHEGRVIDPHGAPEEPTTRPDSRRSRADERQHYLGRLLYRCNHITRERTQNPRSFDHIGQVVAALEYPAHMCR